MERSTKIGIGVVLAVGAAALVAGGGKGGGVVNLVGEKPDPPPGPPPTENGSQVFGEGAGRTWATVGIDRNAKIYRDIEVLTVADFGNGEVLVDVYETIDPPSDVLWTSIACGAARWRLLFENGKLASAVDVTLNTGKPPKCTMGSKPIASAYLRKMSWLQPTNRVVLRVETDSGIAISPNVPPWGPGKPSDWRFDNDMVESGSVLIDCMWRVGAVG